MCMGSNDGGSPAHAAIVREACAGMARHGHEAPAGFAGLGISGYKNRSLTHRFGI